jgi:hypothetical protein
MVQLIAVVGLLPLMGVQLGAAWLNLKMFPAGLTSGARDGLALGVLLTADLAWAVAAVGQLGVVLGLTVWKVTRWGPAWWVAGGSLLVSVAAAAVIVPSQM